MNPVLPQAIQSVLSHASSPPEGEAVVAALQQAEKEARKKRFLHSLDQLSGVWRLCWITGTRRTRQQAGPLLGAGRYIPGWIKITLHYQQSPTGEEGHPEEARGWVENRVDLGGVSLCLSGPVRFLSRKSILAFDFTRIQLLILGRQLWQGALRGGQKAEAEFLQTSIRDQAFFVYFLVEPELIAARGRGGGLALWGRIADGD